MCPYIRVNGKCFPLVTHLCVVCLFCGTITGVYFNPTATHTSQGHVSHGGVHHGNLYAELLHLQPAELTSERCLWETFHQETLC